VAVATQARFAANHFGAELAKHPRHSGAGGAGGEFHDAYSFQGQLRHRSFLNSRDTIHHEGREEHEVKKLKFNNF
jgi:hypothetical protein